MIGDVTAISVATKESGSIVGTSLKTLYSRITGMDQSVDALAKLGISVKDANGEMRSATDVMDELHGKWDGLSKATQQYTAIQIAGRQQLARFLSWMNNYEMGIKATETALNSAGSATRENEAYMESMEAKINQLKVSFAELALTIGDAVLTDSFMGIVAGLKGIMNGGASVVKTIGALPVVMGAVAGVALLLSKNFRASATSMSFMALNTKGLTVALRGLSISMKAVAGTMLLGGAFMAIGFVVEKLIGAFADIHRMQAETKKRTEDMAKAYGNNSDEIRNLAEEYETLSKKTEKTAKEAEKYQEIQNKLGELMPSLIQSEDELGNKKLKQTEYVKEELKIAKQLTDEYAKQKVKSMKSNADELGEKFDGYKEQKRVAEHNSEKAWGLSDAKRNVEANRAIELDGKLQKMQIEGKKYAKDNAKAYVEANGITKKLSKSKQELIDKYIDEHKHLIKTKGDGDDYAKSIKGLSEQTNEFALKLARIPEGLEKVLSTSTIRDLGGGEITAINKANDMIKKGITDQSKLSSALTKGGVENKYQSVILGSLEKAQRKVNEAVKDGADKYIEYEGAVSDATDAEEQKISSSEALVGVTQSELDRAKEQISVYKMLNNQTGLNETQTSMLTKAKEDLSSIMPLLAEGSTLNINAMKREVEQNDILLQAMEALKEGHLNAEQQMTLATALHAKARIQIMMETAEAWKKQAEAQAEDLSQYSGDGDTRAMLEAEKKYKRGIALQDRAQADLKAMLPDMDAWIGKLANATSYQGEFYQGVDETNDVQEEANETVKHSVYLADRYAQALQKLNIELNKQKGIQERTLKYSKAYQDSLKKELELIKEKKKTLQSQANDLEKQIKSGNIKQYGVTSYETYTNGGAVSSSGGSSTKAYTGKYATEINKASKATGVDPWLIASMIKQESNWNPKAISSAGARGLMQLMPATAKANGVSNSYDPAQNIMGGAKEIAAQLKRTGGDINKALIAYNAGYGNLQNVLKSGSGYWKEPKNYYKKVLANYQNYTGVAYGTKTTATATTSNASKSVADYYLSQFKVTDNWLSQRGNKKHGGLDLQGSKAGGELVKAVKGGKVITATYSKTAGNWVVIQQDDGTVAKYMHMKSGSLKVKAGQKVVAGQGLGNVGTTGNSSGNHLHFQVEKNGKAIDPVAYLKQLQKASSGSSSSSGDSEYRGFGSQAEYLSALDQAKSDLLDIKSQLQDINGEIADKRDQIIDWYIDSYDEEIRKQDIVIQRYELGTYGMAQDTQKYRNQIELQKKAIIEKQKLISREDQQIRSLMKSTQMTEVERAKLRDKLDELNSLKYSNAQARDELSWEIVTSLTNQYANAISNLDYKLEKNNALQEQYAEGSKERKKLIKEELAIMEDKRKALIKEAQALENQKYTNPLNEAQRAELQRSINSVMSEVYNLSAQIKQKISSVVDESIEILKRGYEKQKELLVAAKDKEIEELEKAHEKKMEMYEEEYDAYEKIINQKLRALDDSISEDSYNKDMTKLQQEETRLTKKINILSLDNSQDAIAKRIELEQQLKDIQEEIEQKKYDRTNELTKQGLQDELDRYKESIDAKKETADEQYDTEKERLEKEKKAIERHYDEILKDEKFWNDRRQELLNGNIDKMKGKLQEFLNDFKKYNKDVIEDLGVSWSELQNMINDISGIQPDVNNLPSDIKNEQGSNVGGGSNGGANSDSMISAWEKYLSNKRKYSASTDAKEKQALATENEKIRNQYGFIDGHWDVLKYADMSAITNKGIEQKLNDWYLYLHNKKIYASASDAEKKKLVVENQKLRDKWKFPDGAIADLEKIRIYHDGGIVGERGSAVANMLNELQNKKPNERFIKALNGEVMIPEKNIGNVFNNIRKSVAERTSNVASRTGDITKIFDIKVNIDKFAGTEAEQESLVAGLERKFKSLGIF